MVRDTAENTEKKKSICLQWKFLCQQSCLEIHGKLGTDIPTSWKSLVY